MAKRKHSTALFEVITQSSRYAKPQAEVPRTRPVSPGIFGAAKAWLNQKTATKTVSPQVMLPVAEPRGQDRGPGQRRGRRTGPGGPGAPGAAVEAINLFNQ